MITNFFKASRKKRKQEQDLSRTIKQKLLQLTVHYQNAALTSTEPGVGKNKSNDLIISLTSFGERVNDVHLTIESLFQQSLKADKIILWLAQKDFSEEDLPAILRLQQQRGLEIAFCDEDLGPYTKFFYTLQKYPDSLIVTVDDDLLYPHDMLDMLYRAYLKEPTYIHCHRAHKIVFDQNGNILPYKKWEKSTTDTTPSNLIFPTGVGGVLYFPGCFADEILDKNTFLKLSPHADDVWLKAMTLKKGVLCNRVRDSRDWGARFLVIEGSQKFALKMKNKSKTHGNDSKIQAVFKHYKLWDAFSVRKSGH